MVTDSICSVVVLEYPLRDRKVFGSNPPGAESHQQLKIVLNDTYKEFD